MDLLESGDERDTVPLGARLRAALAVRPPRWVPAALAGVLVLGLVGGAVAARDLRAERARQALRVDADLQPGGAFSSTVAGVARGELSVVVVNRRDRAVQVERVEVAVPGLRVLRVDPDPLPVPLAGRQEQVLRIAFVVPDCGQLDLPGAVRVRLAVGGEEPEARELAVTDAADEQAEGGSLRLGACPDSARTDPPGTATDVAVRSSGGSAVRRGPGADGFVRLEVRNAGRQVQLLSVDAQVPGAVFTPRRLVGGRTLVTDEVIGVRLGFRVPDCARLARTGRLVLELERFDGVQEVGLRLTAEPEARSGPQVDLRTVLDACR